MPVIAPKVLAPITGWNSRDPLAAMQPTDAVVMNNLIPEPSGVESRPGYTLSHTLVSTSHWVDTLFRWKTQFGELFIAGCASSAADHGIYNISSSTVATIKTGFMRGQWRHAVMLGSVGMVNGGDDPIRLDYTPSSGIVLRSMNVSTPASVTLKRIHVYKSRSYFASGDEPAFYHSEINALGGVLTRFPIDRVSSTGGNVIEISSWTRDGGIGPDDYLVLFLDTGEVLVYAGSNPTDSNDWGIVGRYNLGRVLAIQQFAGKIHAVTDQDYVVLPDDLLTEGMAAPTKLSGACKAAVKRDRSENWSIVFDTARSWRVVNVPNGSSREQHLLNLASGAATRLTYPANIWSRFGTDLYFGGQNGKVYKVSGTEDAGAAIEWSVQQAFSDFRSPNNKTVLNYRPVLTINGNATFSSGLSYDYENTSFIQAQTQGEYGPPWDTSPWDTTAWGVDQGAKIGWMDGAGEGQMVSLFFNGSSTRQTVWHSTDYRIDLFEDTI